MVTAEQWLLLAAGEDGSDGEIGRAFRLHNDRFSWGEYGQHIEVMKLDGAAKLRPSAERGAGVSYRQLWRAGYVRQEVTARFRVESLDFRVTGDSADLLFALAVINWACGNSAAIPAFAATGTLTERGDVGKVKGLAAKVEAALKVLTQPGSLIFYPQESDSDISDRLIERAQEGKIQLIGIRHIAEAARALGIDIPPTDEPYRGLRPFEEQHRGIYFGRQPDIDRICDQLLKREQERQPGLLLLAASGAGKTSLLQAGLLPNLRIGPNALTDKPLVYRIWRLEQALAADEATLAETIRASWSTLPGFDAMRHNGPASTFEALVLRLPEAVQAGRLRFIWVVDQLEQAFRLPSKETTRAFTRFILGLQKRGVWVISALRGDFYPSYLSSVDLLSVYPTTGTSVPGIYNLATPDSKALDQIINGPAEAAELHFEINRNSGVALNTQLREDIGGQTAALPQLQVALKKLYEDRNKEKGLLLWNQYHGLDKAIAIAADEAIRDLDQDARATLPTLFQALADTRSQGRENLPQGNAPTSGVATARVADLSQWSEHSPVRRLAERLRERWLLTGVDSGIDGQSYNRVKLVHESLLTWDKVKKALDDNLAALLLRSRLHDRALLWHASSRIADRLLQTRLEVEEAANLLAGHRELLDARVDLEFVEQSIEVDALARQQRTQAEDAENRRKQEHEQQLRIAAEDKADAQQQIASEQKQRLVEQKRNNLWARASIAVLVMFLIGASWFAWSTTQSERITREDSALGYFTRGADAIERGERNDGLAFLAKSLRLNPLDANVRLELLMQLDAVGWTDMRQSSLRHGQKLHHASFSPDGLRVVTASEDGTARIWDARTGEAIGSPLKHDKSVSIATFSPDGKRVITISDGTARIWDASPLAATVVSLMHYGEIFRASFSPDGVKVITASLDHTARIWDARTGEAIEPLLKHDGEVSNASFSPDGTRVVTGSVDGTAQVWDVKTGEAIGLPLKHSEPISSASFSPDGTRVTTASWDKTARIWDAKTGNAIGPAMKHDKEVKDARFSPDGALVVTASADRTARIWDARTGEAIGSPMKHDESVYSASFSPDGARVVTVSYNGTASVWNALTQYAIGQPLKHDQEMNDASFSPDGTRVVTTSFDGTEARIWDARNVAANVLPLKHNGVVLSASFSPDGARVITASWDHTARIWNARTGETIGPSLKHDGGVFKASFSLDGSRVVTASEDGTARIWSAQTGEAIGGPLEHGPVSDVSFSPDGARVLTASEDGTARIWNAQTGEAIGLPMKHVKAINRASFSPDGMHVITASADGTAQIWNARTGETIGLPLKHDNAVNNASFSPDGLHVVTASSDHTARVWDVRTSEAIGPALRHEEAINDVNYSPDGARIVTASFDRTARIWDARTGEAVGLPLKHHGAVYSANFSRDGTRVITVANDQAVRIWDVQTGEEIGIPLMHDDNIRTASFSPDGARVVTASDDGTARIWNLPESGAKESLDLADFAELVANRANNVAGGMVSVDERDKKLAALRERLFAEPPANSSDLQKIMRSYLLPERDDKRALPTAVRN